MWKCLSVGEGGREGVREMVSGGVGASQRVYEGGRVREGRKVRAEREGERERVCVGDNECD